VTGGQGAVDAARADSIAASARAGVRVEVLGSGSYADARHIFDTVWPSPDGCTQVQANLLRALDHAGGLVSAAYDDASGDLLGAALAFPGRHRRVDGRWEEHLHSHMAASVVAARDRGIGTALKLHQRWWALEREIPVIAWTFDPIVRRNAWLNLVKLGVEVAEFHRDFYGEMADAINAGDPTDRLLAWWVLGSRRAADAAHGDIRPEPAESWASRGAVWLLRERDGRPLEAGVDESAPALMVALPEDVVALRGRNPQVAAAWRMAVRGAIEAGLGAGYRVDTVTAEGAYVLSRGQLPVVPRPADSSRP